MTSHEALKAIVSRCSIEEKSIKNPWWGEPRTKLKITKEEYDSISVDDRFSFITAPLVELTAVALEKVYVAKAISWPGYYITLTFFRKIE